MKLATELREVTTSGVMETAKATIKATPKIFDFFANATYANKKLAIVRELAANAVDSHVMAGKANVPIDIWLPSDLDPVFRVRDQGLGMSHEFVMGPFMAYTDGSTKSDDNLAIGGFGIGSKSPFAYVDQFTIRSVFDGVVSVYSMFKDEDGIPAIALLAQQSTDEPNGVEVSFPVQNGDAAEFETAAFQALSYFEPLPIIHNAIAGSFNPPVYASRGQTWGMREQPGDLNIIMGGIIYPCVTDSLDYSLRSDQQLSALLRYGLDIRLPIGSCDIALSREALSYTDKTNAAVRQALQDTIDEVAEAFSTMFNDCQTIWQAKDKLGEEVGLNDYRRSYGARAKFLMNNAFYKGEKIDPYVLVKSSCTAWEIDHKLGRRASVSLTNPKWDQNVHGMRLAPSQIEMIIIDDLPISPKSKTIAKVRAYVLEKCTREKTTYVIRHNDGITTEDFIKELGNPPYILTSSLPEPEKQTRERRERPHVRLFTFDGREHPHSTYYGTRHNISITHLNPGMGKGVTEVPYKDQPNTGILVEMKAFAIPEGLRDKIKTGLVKWDELHFANEVDAAKLKPTWQMFDDVFAERLAERLANSDKNLPAALALRNHPQLNPLFARINRYELTADKLTPRQRKTPIGKIVELHDDYLKSLDPKDLPLAKFIEAKPPKSLNPDKLFKAYQEKQKTVDEMFELVAYSPSKYRHLLLEMI